jgi:PAS domain S-box-containing protein
LTLIAAPYLGQTVFPIFFAAVMFSSWFGGLGPGLLVSILAALLSVYFLLPPHYSLRLTNDTALPVTLFLASSAFISMLSEARRRSEARAYTAQERYAVTLNSIGDAVIVTDRNGLVTQMNPIAEALTGWSLAEARNRAIAEICPIINESTRQPVENPIERAVREERIIELTNHTLLIARDGVERPIDDSGAPIRTTNGKIIGAVLVFRDISARRNEEIAREHTLQREHIARDAAEAAERRASYLAQASTLLAGSLSMEATLPAIARIAISETADMCVVYLRMPDGTIRRTAAVHRDPEEEKALLALQATPIDPEGPHPAAEAIRTGQTLIDPVIPDTVIAEVTSAPEEAARLRTLIPGTHLVVPLIARGITLGALSLGRTHSQAPYTAAEITLAQELAQRAALAVDNARLYEEAQTAIRVRDRFLSLAAHELRTPLTTTLAQVQLAHRRLARLEGVEERTHRGLQVAEEQLVRLNKMLTMLLDLSRLEGDQLRIERSTVNLCTLAPEVVERFEGTLTKHTIECVTPEDPLLVHGDALRLEQVLINLLQNAVKYSPEGGTITVRLGRHVERCFFAVTDQGFGIATEDLPHLFQRFYRAPSTEQHKVSGMGIGLYVVQEIVALHGGTVEVTSTPGAGSTFTVWLPLAG